METRAQIAATFALIISALFLFEGLHAAVTVDRAQIVRAYYRGPGHTVLDFADISGPGAADVDTEVRDAGPAFTSARQSKLPLAVQIRSQNGTITAVNINGAWQNVWTISNTSSLVLGMVFLVIGILLLGWPWLRWIRRPSTARSPGKAFGCESRMSGGGCPPLVLLAGTPERRRVAVRRE